MTLEITVYLIYLAISIALTIWVAHTLHKNGRIFLVDVFHGNEPLADSINHLLVVGFYLINLGYASLALSYGSKPSTIDGVIETLSFKVGLVLIVLGVTHVFNMAMIAKLGYRLETAVRRLRTMAQGSGDATGTASVGWRQTP